MNAITLTTLLLLALSIAGAEGQSARPIFIGLQPNITVEPFYEKGELDINVFPVIVEAPIGSRINLKLSPIVNLHKGGVSNGVSDIGLFSVLPIFMQKKESAESKPHGFYIGPVLGFGRNLITHHYTTTLAVEPGYLFETKKRFTISLGMQLGSSYFSYDSQPNKWITHLGPKVSFGFWI